MENTVYDIGIVGAGMAGIFAAHRILEKKKELKTILFDIGRPPLKRRLQMFGFGGLFPNSDGKLYLSDTKKISNIVSDKKAKNAYQWVASILSSKICMANDFNIVKDNGPSKILKNKINKEYQITTNSYVQLFSQHIHTLLKNFADEFENKIEFAFDTEIIDISKNKNIFHILSNEKEYKCKRIIIATGRSGWRWASNIFNKFDLIEDNSTANYGICIEMPAENLKDLNRSTCSIYNNKINVGPFHWNGTIIPEDHYDMAIASFRGNEDRWKTDKVSFNFIGKIKCNNGVEETNRIGKLTFLLANDRISKEKITSILNKKSKILSILPEYDWIVKDIKDFSKIMPEINKGYFYAPVLFPFPPTILLGTNLSTKIPGMFVAGDNIGISGLLCAAETGMIAADGAMRGLT